MDPANADRMIAFLQANNNPDPPIKLILRLYNDQKMAQLRETIAGNTVATSFQLDFEGFVEAEGTNLDPLFAVLQSRDNLTCMIVKRCSSQTMTNRVLLRVATSASSLHSLCLYRATIAPDVLASFLNTSSSIILVYIHGPVFHAQNHSAAAAAYDLADAFGNCASLKTVMLNKLDIAYLKPVVQRLQNHQTLEQLDIGGTGDAGNDQEHALLVASVLRDAKSARLVVVVKHFDFTEQTLAPIAAAAINGIKMPIQFQSCRFNAESTRLFESMVTPTSKLMRLAISCGNKFSKPIDSVVGTLLHPSSSLERLILFSFSVRARVVATASVVTAAMQALVANKQLELLHLDVISDAATFQALLSGIPKMIGLQTLSCNGFEFDTFDKNDLIEAMKRNSTITKFRCAQMDVIFTVEDKAKFALYAARNKDLAALIANPGSIPIAHWAKILERVQDCEYGTSMIFQALQNLGPKAMGSYRRQSGRKRKQVQRYGTDVLL